jgi:integrase
LTKVVASKRRGKSSIQTIAARRKRKPRKVKIPLEPKYLSRLLNHLQDDRASRVVSIMLKTGMHPGVMANPEKYDMEIVRGQLTWHRTKTLALCLWEFDGQDKQLVDDFLANDLGFDESTYWRDVGKVAARADLKYVSPLTLRHTAIIELLRANKTPEQVKQITQCEDETLWTYYARIKNLDRMGEGEVTTNKEDDLE